MSGLESKKTIDQVLAVHPFFKGIDEDHLKLISGCGKNVRIDAGKFVAREGDPADYFYIIRHGRAAIELHSPKKKGLVIATIGEGDVIGWSWLIPPYYWKFDIRAKETVVATALDGKCLRKKCETDKVMGYELLKRFSEMLADGLHQTRLQLLDIYESE